MEIIKAGDPDKKVDKKRKLTCKNCNCEFYFGVKEVMLYGFEFDILKHGLMFVICPWCNCNVDEDDCEEV